MEIYDRVLILYGSETGTGEEVAFKLNDLIRRRGFLYVDTMSMDEYNVAGLPSEKLVIFIASTTGDGDVPKNMHSFWKFLLRKALGRDSLISLNIAVFGLGDSSYEKFNASARRLSTRLKQLGAQEIIPIGLGDDQARYGYFAAFDIWLGCLWEYLHHRYGCPKNDDLVLSRENIPKLYNIQINLQQEMYLRTSMTSNVSGLDTSLSTMGMSIVTDDQDSHETQRQEDDTAVATNNFIKYCVHANSRQATSSTKLCSSIVLENKRLTAVDWHQHVSHIRLNIPEDGMIKSADTSRSGADHFFNAGDVAVVYPRNSSDHVHRLLSLCTTTPACAIITVEPTACNNRVYRGRLGHITCTLVELLRMYLDISGIPARSFFETLSVYAEKNPEEREKLVEISSPAGTDLYYDYCIRERRSYIEVFEEFRSTHPVTVAMIVSLIPPLKPRLYSIASSLIKFPNEVHLCVALDTRRTPLGRTRTGVASGFLTSLRPGDSVVWTVRSGVFVTPPLSSPLIMIGPGTGIAPMRAMLQERLASLELPADTALDKTSLHTVLYFGCRRNTKDFLYADELKALTSFGVHVRIAFSQDQQEKHYVTHDIACDGQLLLQLLRKNAFIMVAGSANKMPMDVRKAIINGLSSTGEVTVKEAQEILSLMDRQKRYIVEAWS